MRLWEFYNSEDDELIEVEADGFEEAYHIAFSDDEFDSEKFELYRVDGQATGLQVNCPPGILEPPRMPYNTKVING